MYTPTVFRQHKADIIIISSNVTGYRDDITEKTMIILRYTANHSLIISVRGELKAHKTSLSGYHTLQGDNSLKSVERFDHMMFVCRFYASR